MAPIVDTLEEMTPAWFTTVLRDGGTLQADATVTGAECRYIGTGQVGSVAQAELTYDEPGSGPASVVIKHASTDAGSRQFGHTMGLYRCELRFYEEIAQLVGVAAPRLYWGALDEETGRISLVLEDLSARAQVGDMLAGATPEQTALAIGQLARLQAPLWGSETVLQREWLRDLTGTRMLFGAVPGALEPFMARFGERIEPHQLELVRRLAPRAPEVVDKVFRPPFVVAHGDYRLDNMMFGHEGGAAPIEIIDWQATRLAPPGLDAAVFLSSCVDTETRRASERGLFEAHVDAMAEAGVRSFSFDDAWASYRAASLFPLLICVFTSVTLEQTERGDAMWTQLLRGAAELVGDLGADAILD